jgi:hypothetical protein
MTGRAAVFLGAVAGAAVGSLAGYLFLTEGGRRLRADWEPKLEEVLRNASALRDTVERATVAASDGWRAVSDTARAPGWSEAGTRAPF